MVRNIILRIPVLRALVPRVSRPLLPFTRLAATAEAPLSLTRPGGRPSTRLFHHFPARLTDDPPRSRSRSPEDPALPPNASLSQRLKHLIKSYGWYALGVYIVLSVADFSVAFAGVNIIGAEHVARVAAAAKDALAGFFPHKPVEPGREEIEHAAAHGGSEGIWAMVALAYTIHKTLFLPVRVGLTAGITPRLVSWLRTRGWAGSAGTKRAAQEVRERIRSRRDRD